MKMNKKTIGSNVSGKASGKTKETPPRLVQMFLTLRLQYESHTTYTQVGLCSFPTRPLKAGFSCSRGGQGPHTVSTLSWTALSK